MSIWGKLRGAVAVASSSQSNPPNFSHSGSGSNQGAGLTPSMQASAFSVTAYRPLEASAGQAPKPPSFRRAFVRTVVALVAASALGGAAFYIVRSRGIAQAPSAANATEAPVGATAPEPTAQPAALPTETALPPRAGTLAVEAEPPHSGVAAPPETATSKVPPGHPSRSSAGRNGSSSPPSPRPVPTTSSAPPLPPPVPTGLASSRYE